MGLSDSYDQFIIPTEDLGPVAVRIGLLAMPVEESQSERPTTTEQQGIRFSRQNEIDDPLKALAHYWEHNTFPPERVEDVVQWFRSRNSGQPELFEDFLEMFEDFLGSLSNPDMRPGRLIESRPVALPSSKSASHHRHSFVHPPALPEGFERPYLENAYQPSLFRTSLPVLLARLGISRDQFLRWHANRWISFTYGTSLLDEYEDPRLNELLFIRDLAYSCLTDAQIRAALKWATPLTKHAVHSHTQPKG